MGRLSNLKGRYAIAYCVVMLTLIGGIAAAIGGWSVWTGVLAGAGLGLASGAVVYMINRRRFDW